MSTELSDEQIIDESRKHATAHVRDSVLTAFARAVIAADRALRPSGGRDSALIAQVGETLCNVATCERSLCMQSWRCHWDHYNPPVLDVHQVSAPVEISSCATCGHLVESGGERPDAADGAWAHCMQMALTDLANIAYQDGRDENHPWSLQWQKLADRVCALAAADPRQIVRPSTQTG